jgi:hypothetical protein
MFDSFATHAFCVRGAGGREVCVVQATKAAEQDFNIQ